MDKSVCQITKCKYNMDLIILQNQISIYAVNIDDNRYQLSITVICWKFCMFQM